MNKKTWAAILIIAVVLIAGASLVSQNRNQPASQGSSSGTGSDPRNATYFIEGQPVMLVNGRAEVETAPGSTAKTVTAIFGTPLDGDLNRDGKADAALIMTQNSGGSGTFYYVVAAIDTGNGVRGTNGVLLGDRIAPQTMDIKDGQVVVNYADRKPGEPMAAAPSVGVTKFFVYNGSMLVAATPIPSYHLH